VNLSSELGNLMSGLLELCTELRVRDHFLQRAHAEQDIIGTEQDIIGTEQDIIGTEQDIIGTEQDAIRG